MQFAMSQEQRSALQIRELILSPSELPSMPCHSLEVSPDPPSMEQVYQRCSQAARDALQQLATLTGLSLESLTAERHHPDSAVPFTIGALVLVISRVLMSQECSSSGYTPAVMPAFCS